jgi:hypothetical protein
MFPRKIINQEVSQDVSQKPLRTLGQSVPLESTSWACERECPVLWLGLGLETSHFVRGYKNCYKALTALCLHSSPLDYSSLLQLFILGKYVGSQNLSF